MSRKSKLIEVVIFFTFIFSLFIINLITKDKVFSEQENRMLQQRPKLSVESLLSGKFMENFESYVSDQFVLRDKWINIKAGAELASGKMQNNGVFLCRGDVFIEPLATPDKDSLDKKTGYINSLNKSFSSKIYLALIPGKEGLYSDLLPTGINNANQSEVIKQIYDAAETNNIDMQTILRKHSSEYIFYRTDHHWTTLGAYYGSCAILNKMDLPYPELSSFSETRKVISESFYGTTYSKAGFSNVKPDVFELFVPALDVKVLNYGKGKAEAGNMYDLSFADKKDKYSVFFGGNTPLLEIQTNVLDKESLLIIRDSFADSLTPFLMQSFSKISVIDLRYYNSSLKEYIEKNNFDKILICYSLAAFINDTNLYKLSS